MIPCTVCSGSGLCKVCSGSGDLGVKTKSVLRNVKRKLPDGQYVNETITVQYDEHNRCAHCGGTTPTFRSGFQTSTPFDVEGLSPASGRPGDGKCRQCKGIGKVLKVSPSKMASSPVRHRLLLAGEQ